MVHSFFTGMELALGAATAAISRAGASSLAELAAMRVPAILVPYPVATDNHQLHNAEAFVHSGAARLLEQRLASPELLARSVLELVNEPGTRERMKRALALWQAPHAADHAGKCRAADSNRTGNSNNPADRYFHRCADGCSHSHRSLNADP